MRLIAILLLAPLVACQTLQDPEKALELSLRIQDLQTQIENIEAGGGEVPPELLTSLAALIEQLADSEGQELPVDLTAVGASGAILLGLYNQMFGSRRSARLEKKTAS